MLFALLFLILPTMHIVVGAFRTPEGDFTLENIANLFTPSILGAFWISIRISFASALLGCVIGFCDRRGDDAAAACRAGSARR